MTKCVPAIVDKRARKALRHVSRFARLTRISYKQAHKLLTADFDYGQHAKRMACTMTYDPLRNIDCGAWPSHTEERPDFIKMNYKPRNDIITPAAPSMPVSDDEISKQETLLERLQNCLCAGRRRRNYIITA